MRARAGEELAAAAVATAAAPAAAATPTAPRLRLPLLSRVDVQRSKLGKKGGSAKREAQLEESIKHLQHKQGKMDGEGHSAQCGEGGTAGGGDREETGRRKGGDREPCRQFVLPADGSAASIFQHRPSSPPPPAPAVASQSFVEKEARLHRDLTTLIMDARWLRRYGRRAGGRPRAGSSEWV